MTAKKTPNKVPAKKGEQKAKLDAIGIDAVCEMILNDMSYAAIGAKFQMTAPSVAQWLDADPLRSARARDARVRSAAKCDELALAALQEISDDGSNAMVARQREIASHYRWRAKVRNPREYGDAIKIDGDLKVTQTIEQVDAKIAEFLKKVSIKDE